MFGPSSVKCGRCGGEVKGRSRYCTSCGAVLSAPEGASCPRCGTGIAGGASFCPRCGYDLTSKAGRPRSRAGPLVSVMTIAATAIVLVLVLNNAGPVLDPLNPLGPPDYSMGTGTVEYTWEHDRRTYSLQVNITSDEYQRYREDNIARQARSFTQMVQLADQYVTSDDSVIREVAASFERTRDDLGLDKTKTIELVLSFIQTIAYVEDSESTLRDEYWRYPVETLQDKVGDCEDKVFLFASIMEAMGYDAVALFFDGHAAAGIDLEGAKGSHYSYEGTEYYYCETTSYGWDIGETPQGLSGAFVAQVE